ncbi:transposase [Lewinella cohaerens]|uniref:transposase n=1 Tax=Lewinella cohaerens TaxID=70995 RepID=UPI00039CF62F|nr:transposase [Lewinella cohaerens]
MMQKENAKIPHQNLGYRPVHLTYRLSGSLPVRVLEDIRLKYEERKRQMETKFKDNPELLRSGLYAHEAFVINARFELDIDEVLHKIKSGPFYLQEPLSAEEVIQSWKFLHDHEDVYLYAVCVMGNHVHAIVRAPNDREEVDIGRVMNRHKAHTARVCNKIIGKTGSPFWEPVYFDRTVRQNRFEQVMWYVLNNPVKVGLVSHWWEWGGTYLNPDFDTLFRPG